MLALLVSMRCRCVCVLECTTPPRTVRHMHARLTEAGCCASIGQLVPMSTLLNRTPPMLRFKIKTIIYCYCYCYILLLIYLGVGVLFFYSYICPAKKPV